MFINNTLQRDITVAPSTARKHALLYTEQERVKNKVQVERVDKSVPVRIRNSMVNMSTPVRVGIEIHEGG
jgi:hypothetical protein